jgi:elongation of very long chain fatty acids protein 7
MGNPVPTLIIIGLYYWFVTIGGPKLMKNRDAFTLSRIMMVYNLVQVIVNSTACIYAIYWTYWQDYFSLKCQPIHRFTDVRGTREFQLTYIYFLIKLMDLLDTVEV